MGSRHDICIPATIHSWRGAHSSSCGRLGVGPCRHWPTPWVAAAGRCAGGRMRSWTLASPGS